MIYVRDLIKLKVFQQLELVGGKDGIYRTVSWPTMGQTENIREWLVGGDVIIVTGIGFQNFSKVLYNYVQEAVEKHSACLIILISKEYIKKIPDNVLKYANKNHFPIFSAPWEIKIAEIIKEIATASVQDTAKMNTMTSLTEDLLFGKLDLTDSKNIDRVQQYHLEEIHQVVVAKLYVKKEKTNQIIKYSFEQQIKMLLIEEMRVYYERLLYLMRENYMFMIVENHKSINLERILMIISHKLEKRFSDIQIRFGVGMPDSGIKSISQSFQDAVSVMKIENDKKIITASELGFLRVLLHEECREELANYASTMLAPLKKYDERNNRDLMSTLREYLEHNLNIAKTAEVLFLHRNTLIKRISKIEEILDVDLKNSEITHELYNCFHFIKYLK